MSKESQLTVGVVGPGHIASVHNAALNAVGAVIIGYVSKPDRAPVNAVGIDGRRLGWGNRYDSLDKLLDNGRPDAVLICATPDTRGSYERVLASEKIPFLIEKPLGLDIETPLLVAKEIDRTGVPAAVGYHWRATDFFRCVKDDLKDKTVTGVKARWYDSSVENAPAWWFNPQISGGPVLDQLSHMVDITRHLAGEMQVTGVQSFYTKPEDIPRLEREVLSNIGSEGVQTQLKANVIFDNGALGTFEYSSLLPPGEVPFIGITVNCDDGTKLYADVHKETFYNNGTAYVEKKHTIPKTPQQHFDGYREQDRAFLWAVQSQDPSVIYCSYRQALGTQRTSLDILEKAVPVEVPLFTHEQLYARMYA
jgi:myo-inositol 2-dehydrogenase / D-chiro-inositol 1-dehydrogenase